MRSESTDAGTEICGLSRCSTAVSSPPGKQVPRFASGPKKAFPGRFPGKSDTTDHSRGVKSAVVPSWLRFQRAIEELPLSNESARRTLRFCDGLAQSGGGSCASSGSKPHWVGGVRISTAAMALATCWQSPAEITSPDGVPSVREERLLPTKSAQDCSSASACSAKLVAGPW